jgi:hypothetical protein
VVSPFACKGEFSWEVLKPSIGKDFPAPGLQNWVVSSEKDAYKSPTFKDRASNCAPKPTTHYPLPITTRTACEQPKMEMQEVPWKIIVNIL